MFIIFSFTIGCERASLNRIGKDVYYMQIKGEGTIEKVDGRNLRNYTLHMMKMVLKTNYI